MAVVLQVSFSDSMVFALESRPLMIMITKAPNAPTPAAAVGVNQPVYSPPITTINKVMMLQVSFNFFIHFLANSPSQVIYLNTEIMHA